MSEMNQVTQAPGLLSWDPFEVSSESLHLLFPSISSLENG